VGCPAGKIRIPPQTQQKEKMTKRQKPLQILSLIIFSIGIIIGMVLAG
jgi:hypothetical protein